MPEGSIAICFQVADKFPLLLSNPSNLLLLLDLEIEISVRRERDELQCIVQRVRGHTLDAMGLEQVDALEHELKEV